MSVMTAPAMDSAERLAKDAEDSHAALCERIASLLRPLARDGVALDVSVHVRGKSVSVKVDPPPRAFLWDGNGLRRRA